MYQTPSKILLLDDGDCIVHKCVSIYDACKKWGQTNERTNERTNGKLNSRSRIGNSDKTDENHNNGDHNYHNKQSQHYLFSFFRNNDSEVVDDNDDSNDDDNVDDDDNVGYNDDDNVDDDNNVDDNDNDDDVDDDSDVGDDDDVLPAYSHLVSICHGDEMWEHDTVTFLPCINSSSL